MDCAAFVCWRPPNAAAEGVRPTPARWSTTVGAQWPRSARSTLTTWDGSRCQRTSSVTVKGGAMSEVIRGSVGTGTQHRSGNLEELPLLIPVPVAARLLGISRSAAYRCAASGDLPTTHLGGRVYVITARLRSMLEST